MATVFFLAVGCAVLSQLAAALAWRHRRAGLEKWRWLTDPTVLFRTSYYQQPPPQSRLVAIALQVAGALGVAWVVFHLITAQQSGATQICGLSF